MTTKSKKLRPEGLINVSPMTTSQEAMFKAWERGQNVVASGSAGTGKTFLAMYMGMQEVLKPKAPYDKIIIVRSIVPTRNIGYLPGTEEEKCEVYQAPYKKICQEIFADKLAWDKGVASGQIEFESTSFLRGMTLDNCVVVFDEFQNCTYHEIKSVITRLGENTRIILSGDYHQTDLNSRSEKTGIDNALRVLQSVSSFSQINFGPLDIVRSGMVREFLINEERLITEGKITV